MTPNLEQAIALIKSGKKNEAQKILEPLLEANKENITAWLWYAETWPTLQQKIKTLEMCLEYNPNDNKAKQALATLRSRHESAPPQNTPAQIPPRPKVTPSRLPTPPAQSPTPAVSHTTSVPHTPPHAAKTIISDEQLINQYIALQTKKGWQILNQTASSVQLKKSKQWNRLLLVLGLVLLCIYGLGLLIWLVALIDYAIKKEAIVFMTADNLRAQLKTPTPTTPIWRNPIVLVGGVLTLVCVGLPFIGLLMSFFFSNPNTPATSQTNVSTNPPISTSTSVPVKPTVRPSPMVPTLLNSLAEFESSQFCQTYKCKADDSWEETPGVVHHYLASSKLNVDIFIHTINGKPVDFELDLYGKDSFGILNDYDFKSIYAFLSSVHPGVPIDSGLEKYLQQNIENDFDLVCEIDPIQFGLFRIWAGGGSTHIVFVSETCPQ